MRCNSVTKTTFNFPQQINLKRQNLLQIHLQRMFVANSISQQKSVVTLILNVPSNFISNGVRNFSSQNIATDCLLQNQISHYFGCMNLVCNGYPLQIRCTIATDVPWSFAILILRVFATKFSFEDNCSLKIMVGSSPWERMIESGGPGWASTNLWIC